MSLLFHLHWGEPIQCHVIILRDDGKNFLKSFFKRLITRNSSLGKIPAPIVNHCDVFLFFLLLIYFKP